MLDVNDFYSSPVVPWDPNQYVMNDSRQFIGFGGCFRIFIQGKDGGYFCISEF